MVKFKYIWDESKLNKWINRARKHRLTIDFENGFILDGYSIFKIGDELKKILNTRYMITGSVTIMNGEITNNVNDLKKIFDGFCVEHEKSKQLLELTSYCRIMDKVTLSILYSENLTLEINKSFLEVVAKSFGVKFYGTGETKPLAIEYDGEVIGFILPTRSTSAFEIKKAAHIK